MNFDELSGDQQQTVLNQMISELGIPGQVDLSANYQNFQNQFVDGSAFGGGVNYNVPTPMGQLGANVSGGGYNVNTPVGRFSDVDLRNIGLMLNRGNQQFGINYQPQGTLPVGQIPSDAMLANELPGVPVQDFLQLNYRYNF